jgi:predicted enzyme related to lactoylglutathione lyase
MLMRKWDETVQNHAITGVDASYYMTKDLEAAALFYERLLGVPPSMTVPSVVVEWTLGDGATFGLYHPQDSAEWRPGGGILFHADDLATAVDVAKKAGAAVDEPYEDTPMCTMAFAVDPEGNRFILHQRKG